MTRLINSLRDYQPEVALSNVVEAFKIDIKKGNGNISQLNKVFIRCTDIDGKPHIYTYRTRIVEELDHSRCDSPDNFDLNQLL